MLSYFPSLLAAVTDYLEMTSAQFNYNADMLTFELDLEAL